jgi:hypothetical protein
MVMVMVMVMEETEGNDGLVGIRYGDGGVGAAGSWLLA